MWWSTHRGGAPNSAITTSLCWVVLASGSSLPIFLETAITDRAAWDIAAMKKLRQLRLAHTAIADKTIQELASLDQLESLSIFDTRVTESSL